MIAAAMQVWARENKVHARNCSRGPCAPARPRELAACHARRLLDGRLRRAGVCRAYPDRVQALALIDYHGLVRPNPHRRTGASGAATAATKGFQALSAFQATRWVSDAFREAHPQLIRANLDVFLANDIDCYTATCEMLGDARSSALSVVPADATSVIVGEEDYATPSRCPSKSKRPFRTRRCRSCRTCAI